MAKEDYNKKLVYGILGIVGVVAVLLIVFMFMSYGKAKAVPTAEDYAGRFYMPSMPDMPSVPQPTGYCGDGQQNDLNAMAQVEHCDGRDLAGNDCTTINRGFTGGTLRCGSNCLWDTSGCVTATEPKQTGGILIDDCRVTVNKPTETLNVNCP